MRTTGVRKTATYGLAGAVATALSVLVLPTATADHASDPLSVAARVGAEVDVEPREITSVGDRAFFIGYTEEHGEELWTSDGTTEGTTLVEDIRPGPDSSTYYLEPSGRGAVLGDVLFFVADDGVHGGTLWRSDGTAAGTQLVEDVVPGVTTGIEVESLTEVGGVLYFIAVTGSGTELWRSDGTGAGTVKVADTSTGCESLCYVGPVVGVGGDLVFVAGDDADGELWRSDGTAAGTAPIGPTTIRQLTASGDHAYFTTGEFGYDQLWQTDGTTAGTEPLPGAARAGDWVDTVTGLTDVAGELFYMVDYLSETNGERYELRRVDETSGTGTLVRGFTVEEGGNLSPEAGSVIAVGDVLYFVPVTLSGEFFPGDGLWRSDGTPAGTTRLLDGYAYRLAEVAGQVMFARPSTDVPQWRLWRTDGTVAGTEAVTATPFKYPFNMEDFVEPSFADVGGEAFFAGTDLTSEPRIWKVGSDSAVPDTLITGGFADGEVVTAHEGDYQRFTFAVDDDFTPTDGALYEVQVDGGPWHELGSTFDFQVRDFEGSDEGPHTISVRATDAAGHVDPTPATRSFVIDLEPPEPMFNQVEPSIDGTARLGGQLVVDPGLWFPEPDSLTYQWLRDGSPIAGATGSAYDVTVADIGRRLVVRERAEATDHVPATATSSPVTVDRVGSTTKLSLPKARIRARTRAKAVVRVTAAAAVSADGRVTVRAGRKKLGTATLTDGRAALRLARLPRGTYRLKASYAGSPVLRPSTSTKVRLVVRR